MKRDPEFETTMRLAERTLARADAYATPPNPRNFELLYTYVTGLRRELNEAIEQTVSEKQQLASGDASRLYREHISDERFADKIEEVGRKLSGEIGKVIERLERAEGAMGAYGESLATGGINLRETVHAPHVERILNSLSEATEQMAQSNKDLRENFACSENQIEELNACLELARSELSLDSLTHLSNRRHFDHVLEEAILESARRGKPLSLLMIDIDHFKQFNDTFGHQTGDSILRIVARSIRGRIKGQDLAARYGGEEFAVILPNTRLEDAAVVAEQIRLAIGAKQLVRKATRESLGRITVSIGVATCRMSDTPESLVRRADVSLYAAKRVGRNQVVSETALPSRSHDAA